MPSTVLPSQIGPVPAGREFSGELRGAVAIAAHSEPRNFDLHCAPTASESNDNSIRGAADGSPGGSPRAPPCSAASSRGNEATNATT